MFCTKCGKQISDGAKFCTICGNPITGQRVEPKKEAFQTAAVTKPLLLQKKLHQHYVLAAFACIAGSIIINLLLGVFFSSVKYLLNALILPLLLVFAQKKYYKKLQIASFALVGFQLLLAIITLCYAFEEIPLLKALDFNGCRTFQQLRFFFLIHDSRCLLTFLKGFLYILVNAICGIAFLKLSKFPEEK